METLTAEEGLRMDAKLHLCENVTFFCKPGEPVNPRLPC